MLKDSLFMRLPKNLTKVSLKITHVSVLYFIGSFRNISYGKQRSAHLEFRGALSFPDGLKEKKLFQVN